MRLVLLLLVAFVGGSIHAQEDPKPFGENMRLDSKAVREWWVAAKKANEAAAKPKGKKPPKNAIPMMVPRDEVVSFSLYTHDSGVLKMTAQLYPLLPDESREVRLEFQRDGKWTEAARVPITFPGWSAHFRIEKWDNSETVPYRVLHGKKASFSGSIRKDPADKSEIVVGLLNCNSTRTPGPRPQINKNVLHQDPDVLFFAGDQTYHHTEHTMGWLQFGQQFRDIMRDRPTITIPDDHDIGQGNLWGEYGIQGKGNGDSGGYIYSAEYVKMVDRCQTWHLPDPAFKGKIHRGIGTYFTRLRVGGVDFAILEDRKFKSGPNGKIPKMGPRADHINDPKYERAAVDLPELKLLGEEQLSFLQSWGQDWTRAEMKCVLSQTAFCGAVHIHGGTSNRLLADLDSNAWPQTGRNKALREIRRAWAPHLCGDQHLAVLVQHGIENYNDGPYGFTGPAIVNTIYGRWWHPQEEKAGPNPVPNSPLPWTGNYLDGLGNKIRMLAYANPPNRGNEKLRADGHGIVRFNKETRKITFESWHRFTDIPGGDSTQFDGWPVTIDMADNDGRKATHTLPTQKLPTPNAVVQVLDANNQIVYTIRAQGDSFTPKVYAPGRYIVKAGANTPDKVIGNNVAAVAIQ
ncbi:MAG: hypothetical protein ACI8W8_004911 [Rhodothermales bacterium]|jgi:hypothetical protein